MPSATKKALPPCPYHGSTPRGNNEVLAARRWFSTPDPDLRSLSAPIVQWPVTSVLLSGGIGDYAAYIGIGAPSWVAKHGNKLGFEEALGFFPHITRERYRE